MIRLATPTDLDQVLRIERAAFTAPHWPWEAYEQMLTTEGVTHRVLFVAVEDDRVLGFAGGTRIFELAQLESIAVAEAARRRGLGLELCRTFVDWAAHGGADTVGLEVRAGSAGAQSLYASLGFKAIGLRRNYYTNPVEDGILMQRPAVLSGAAGHV